MIELDETQKQNLLDAGKFGFSKNKLAAILNMPKNEVKKALDDPNSEISKFFIRGREISLLNVCQSLEKMALDGNRKAAETLLEYKKHIIERHAIDDYFGE